MAVVSLDLPGGSLHGYGNAVRRTAQLAAPTERVGNRLTPIGYLGNGGRSQAAQVLVEPGNHGFFSSLLVVTHEGVSRIFDD